MIPDTTFDFIFMDADRGNYQRILELYENIFT
jgi:predicted O-methyltransferase YrrM